MKLISNWSCDSQWLSGGLNEEDFAFHGFSCYPVLAIWNMNQEK